VSIRVHPWLKIQTLASIIHPKMNSGKEFPSAFAPVFTALRRGESLRRDKSVPHCGCAPSARFPCGIRMAGRPESNAQATALQTLARPPGRSALREAFGLLRVYRRFSHTRPSQNDSRK
jgi:hypothetical protein